jgi:hypothetical protein
MYGLSPDAADHMEWLEEKNEELERENAELTQSLERACKWFFENVDFECYRECPINCSDDDYIDQRIIHPERCVTAIIKYFKEGKQDG